MPTRIKFRRDTSVNWFNVNPILLEGEMGLETNSNMFKLGDGITVWRNLPYISGGTSVENHVGYLTCETASAVGAKTVEFPNFGLTVHARLSILFLHTNTAFTVSLNINNTGVKDLMFGQELASSVNTWADGQVLDIIYDGEKYITVNFSGLFQLLSEKAQNSGYAPLNNIGLVPEEHLPGYVDSILEFPTFQDFPVEGASSTIYIALNTNYQYRWSGTQYILLTILGGDFTGPDGAGDENLIIFDGVTGKLGKDSGIKISELQSIANVESIRNSSWAEGYMLNHRDQTLDYGSYYFPNKGAFEIGYLKTLDLWRSVSLFLVPSSAAVNTLFSVKPFGSPFTCERSSPTIRINADGVHENIAANFPHINPYSEAIISEPERKNLLLFPFSYDNAYWDPIAASVDDNGGNGYAAPFVEYPTSAFKLVEDNTDAVHFIQLTDDVVIVNEADHSLTFLAKKGERNFVRLAGGSGIPIDIYYDLENGVVGTENSGAGSIEELADGWYECKAISESVAVGTKVSLTVVEEDNTPSYQGDGSSGVYISASQFEEGSFPTSIIYINSEGSQITRNNDSLYNDNNILNVGIGDFTMLIEFEYHNTEEIRHGIFDDANNRAFLVIEQNYIEFYAIKSGTTIHQMIATVSLVIGTGYKLAITLSNGVLNKICLNEIVLELTADVFVGGNFSFTNPFRLFHYETVSDRKGFSPINMFFITNKVASTSMLENITK